VDTFTAPPPSPYQSVHSESYLASLIDHDSPQPDITHIFLNNLYSMFIESSTTVYGRDIIHNFVLYTRAVRKVSGHFEYLEDRPFGLNVTWQPVRGDLTDHP